MTRRTVLSIALLSALIGCQGTNPITSRHAASGSLHDSEVVVIDTEPATGAPEAIEELPLVSVQPVGDPEPIQPRSVYDLTLKNFIGGESYTGGSSMFLFWILDEPTVRNITRRLNEKIYIAYSNDSGLNWQGKQEASFESNRVLWRLPKIAGDRYRVKVWLEDEGKTVASDESKADFVVHTGVATAKLDVVPTTRTGTAEIAYRLEPSPHANGFIRPDGSPGAHDPVEAVVWYTIDNGKNWRKYESYAADGNRISFNGEDGTYGLYLSMVDDEGLSSAIPTHGTEPMARLLIDTRQPEVNVSTQMDKGDPPGLLVTWNLNEDNLPKGPVTLFLSDNNGASWQVAARDIEHTGSYRLPIEQPGKAYRVAIAVKDKAGNITRKEATHGVIVDNVAPVTVAIGPTVSSNSEVHIRYVIRDTGGSGVRQTTLYYTRNEGITWEKYRTFEHGEPITFVEADGSYGIFLISSDWAGNDEQAPRDGTEPHLMLTVHNEAPQIALQPFADGAILRGGTMVQIKWDGTGGYLSDLPVTLEYFDGAGWNGIEGQFPRMGSTAWTAPRINSRLCKIRVRITNRHGASASSETQGQFAIDSTAPRVVIGLIANRPPKAITIVAGGNEPGRTLQNGQPATANTATPTTGNGATVGVTSSVTPVVPRVVQTVIPTESVPEMLEKSRELMAQGKPYLAERHLRKAMAIDPNNEEVLSGLGYVLYRQKRFKESEAVYLDLIKLNRTTPEPHYQLGLIYFERESLSTTEKTQNNDWAEFRFKEALRLHPKHHKASNMLGMVFYRRNQYEDSLTYFDTAIHDSGDVAIYHFNRAVALFKLGRYEDCVHAAKSARRLDGQLHFALWYIAKSYTKMNETEAAADYWHQTAMAFGTESRWGSLALAELNALEAKQNEGEK